MVHGYLQVLEEGDLRTGLVVKRYHFVENREVACFLDIGNGTEDEPAGVVVEASADVVISTLGEWLVLVVTSAVGELRRCDVDDTLTGTWWYLMYETHEVLVGVTEPHATSHAALEEGGAS